MSKSISHRLSFHSQRNIIAISISIIIVIGIYLTINSIEKSSKVIDESLLNRTKISICPELKSSSRGYFRVNFTNDFPVNYSSICNLNDNILVYILSTTQNFQRRESIRQTWANKNNYEQLNEVCFIFIVGISPVNLAFNDRVKEEASLYNDIVQLDIKETYQNVVYKEVGALKWSHLYASQIPFLYKTDDDLILDSLLLSDIAKFLVHNRTDHSLYFQKHQQLKNFVQEMNNADRFTLFRGTDLGGIPTLRSGKFSVHELAWNHDTLPPYCSGFGFIFSSFIRDRLYRASLCFATEYVPMVGDLFLSGFLAGAASVRCSAWSIVNIQALEPCAPLFEKIPELVICSTPLHNGQQTYADFYQVWQIILRRHPTTSHMTITLPTTVAPITTTTTIKTSTTTVRTTTAMMVNISLSIKRDKLLAKNLSTTPKMVKENEIRPVLLGNSSNSKYVELINGRNSTEKMNQQKRQ